MERLNSVSSSSEKLETRIKAVIDLYKSRKSASEVAGVSTDMLSRYMRGDSQPGFSVIVNLCRPVGVSLSWVADGKGAMMLADLAESDESREDRMRAMAGDEEAEARCEVRYQEFRANRELPLPEVQEALKAAGANIDHHWQLMLAGWVDRYGIESQHIKDLASLLGSQAELASEFALIPGYDIQVAAGTGALPDNERPTRKLAFRHKWLKYKGLNEKDLVLVFAKGDSMEPTISDNNTLMIDTNQRDLSDGSIYVIRTDHHLIVKRVQTLWNKGILLLSDNKEYETQQVDPNEADDLEVIGKVVWVGKDM